MTSRVLPLDEDSYLARLKRWVECESPTWDEAAVERMLDIAARDLAILGAEIQRIPGRMGFAGAIKARLNHARADEPGILVLGHLDTVHPVGVLAQNPWRREGDICWGPGILDMKGGLCLVLEALESLRRANIASDLPITILLTGEEEVGTPSCRDLIEAEAVRHRYVLVPEPARANGNLVSGRYAIARFDLRTIGRPSHAGGNLKAGRSAIKEMARRIIEIEDMTTDDRTFSVGVIQGGQWVNCVAATCTAEALSMAKRQEDLDLGVQAMLALSGERNDIVFEARLGVVRPVWETSNKTLQLFGVAQSIAKDIGFELGHESSGGGSDGNFTGALGIPTLDGVGAKGSGMHTLDEQIEVKATLERGQLLAGLLSQLR